VIELHARTTAAYSSSWYWLVSIAALSCGGVRAGRPGAIGAASPLLAPARGEGCGGFAVLELDGGFAVLGVFEPDRGFAVLGVFDPDGGVDGSMVFEGD